MNNTFKVIKNPGNTKILELVDNKFEPVTKLKINTKNNVVVELVENGLSFVSEYSPSSFIGLLREKNITYIWEA